MITITQQTDTNIVEMELDGSVTAEEFDDVLAKFDASIKQHGTIRVLEVIRSLGTPPIPWSKLWEDIKFGFGHLSDIECAAVVSDYSWMSAWVTVWNPLFKAEIKAFKLDEIDQAREWLANHST